jgi:formylglycine-generating enzyme required for sulfatase activity
MKRLFAVLALAANVVALARLSSASQKDFDPIPRKQEILKLFVDEFVTLTPGMKPYPRSFLMGSTNADDQQPVHEVALAGPFAMAKNEVTQELYQVVMGNNPSKWKGPRNAVELTSWHDANAFCGKATELLRAAKLFDAKTKVRLSTEAEWEYACRAGTKTAWSFGDDLGDLTEYCWYNANSKGHDPPVGLKKGNPWGLFDMHGYNWEWVQDDYAPDYKNAPKDGKAFVGPAGADKVVRGGAWNAPANASRSAHRHHAKADHKDDTLGFRCVKVSID